ncbi:MAG: DEAD/DEAH box helicase, partial [Planctomycetaceae bacterium]
EYRKRDGFSQLIGRGSDWSPRVYIQLVTELFQRGLTRCLVGTRGLLGEGWDANRINVLIDLTCVTTSMSVNQLRGRSIRLDPAQPKKLADNWDVVCVAPEFTRGLDDYARFRRKHKTIFGVTDDGAIEKGVGHVHAAFTELKPEGIESSSAALNSDMLARVDRRNEARELWKIGQPYHPDPVNTLEVKLGGGGGGFPPFPGGMDPWSSGSLTAAVSEAVLGALCETGLISDSRQIRIGERDGGYVRVFLEDSNASDSALFTDALRDAIGPLDRPRYVIPRSVNRFEATLLSRLLPDIVGHYFRKTRCEMAMLHAVPAVLAKKRELVDVYQRHWNCHVSPGEALFAHRGAGEELIEECQRDGLVPKSSLHRKDVFLSKESESHSAGDDTGPGHRRLQSADSTSRARRLN